MLKKVKMFFFYRNVKASVIFLTKGHVTYPVDLQWAYLPLSLCGGSVFLRHNTSIFLLSSVTLKTCPKLASVSASVSSFFLSSELTFLACDQHHMPVPMAPNAATTHAHMSAHTHGHACRVNTHGLCNKLQSWH